MRRLLTIMLCLVVGLPLTIISVAPSQAVVIDPVALRQTLGVYGDFVQTGNGVLRCDPNAAPGSQNACSNMHSGISGINDDYRMIYADVDNNPGTYNSSSGTITIPAGSTVRYARLYWAASNGVWLDNKDTGQRGCGTDTTGFTMPTAPPSAMSRVQFTAAGLTTTMQGENLVNQQPGMISPSGQKDSHGLYYSDSTEVTAQLANLPSGTPQTITVGNIWAPQGTGCFGGWNLQVIYGYDSYDPAQPASMFRNVYRFAGHIRQYQGDSDIDLTLNGLAPQDEGSRAGLVVFEGDANLGNESLTYSDAIVGSRTLTNIRGNDRDFWVSAAQGSVPYAPYTGGLFVNGAADSYVTPIPTAPGVNSLSLKLEKGQDSYLFMAAMISVPYADVTIKKTAISGDDYQVLLPGQQPRYRITVENSGSAALNNIAVTDARAPNCARPVNNLAAGGTFSYECAGPATSAALTNEASVNAVSPVGLEVIDTDTTEVQIARIDLVKTSNQPDVAYGTPATWTITINNPGTAELRSVAVSDPLSPNCVRSGIRIAAGQSHSYTCSSPNLTEGMTNSASAVGIAGSPAQTAVNVAESDTTNNHASVKVTGIRMTQTASTLYARPGDTVRLNYTIFNELETVLNPVSLANGQFPGCDSTTLGPIEPGRSASHSCDVVITEPITSTATVAGTSPSGVRVTSANSLRIETKDIRLEKSGASTDVNANNLLDAGDRIAYSFIVSNTGSSKLTGIRLTDPMLTGVSCPATTLEPYTSMSCTANPYIIKAADVQAGTLVNTATVRAEGPDGTTSPTDDVVSTASQTFTPDQVPDMAFTKTASPTSVNRVGQLVTYTFTATNTGNVTVTNVRVADPMPGLSALSCSPAQPASIAPGQTMTCTATRATTQVDLTAGSVANTATLSFVEPKGSTLNRSANTTVIGEQLPAIDLVATSSPLRYSTVGQRVTVQLTATNTGNVPLSSVVVTDTTLGQLSCEPAAPASLAPGASQICPSSASSGSEGVVAGRLARLS